MDFAAPSKPTKFTSAAYAVAKIVFQDFGPQYRSVAFKTSVRKHSD